jgi:uncharacterized repeat protein (TIGR01451 family)
VVGAVGVAGAFAGCSESDDSDSGGSDSTSDSGPAATDTPTETAESDIRLTSIEAPAEVEVGQEYTYTIKLENTGTADGTFTGTIEASVPDSGTVNSRELEIDVPAGETVTRESDPVTTSAITEVTLSIGAVSTAIQFVSARRTFGDSFRAPTEVIATVNGVTLQSEYEHQDFRGETATESAPEGQQYAFVDVTAENASGSSEYIPFDQDFTVRVGSSQYDAAFISRERGMYDGGQVGPGVVREGEIAYEIPEGVSQVEITVEWFETGFDGDYGVRWSAV